MSTLARDQIFSVLKEELLAMDKPEAAARMSEAAHFKHDMGLDSLDIVEFVARAELHYRVHVKDEDFSALDRVGKVIDYVLERVPETNA
ncbi:MAG: hypothetical protein KDI63_01490 [Gammaproteobacteria bacterium]|nr:hypothetical protein [Gammaproteobacteria bacterium]